MQYIVVAFLFLLALGLFYKIVAPVGETDFKLKGTQSKESLRLSVSSLANRCRNCEPKGRGLSLRLIKRHIVRAYKIIARKIKSGKDCHDFELWLYDNFYKFNASILKQHKSIHTYIKLPYNDGLPRIYRLVELVVKSSDGCVNAELFRSYVQAFNDETPLNFREICSIRSILEYCLLEYAAIFASKVNVINREISRGEKDAARERIDLSSLQYNSYVYGFYNAANTVNQRKFNKICLDNSLDAFTRIDNFYAVVSRYNGQIQSAVTSLYKIEQWCTDQYILELSPLNSIFEQERGILYNDVTMATKYLYLNCVYDKAHKSKCSELALAREVFGFADRDKKDIAHFILPPPKQRKVMYLYLFALTIISVALLIATAIFFRDYKILKVVLGLPIFVEIAVLLVISILRKPVKRRQMPRLDLKSQKPSNIRSMIVFSRLIGSETEIEDAYRRLETTAAANGSPIFSYGLLLDFPSNKDGQLSERDNLLIDKCNELYERLEDKKRFNLFVRKRKKVEGEQKYQGWEKKRGALIELNRYILSGDDEAFLIARGNSYDVKYIIPLDSDTQFNCAYELVEIMEHPYNSDKNVISVKMSTCPESATASPFAELFCGGTGLDNYSDYLADEDYDLFGSGNFTGKGIYRVGEFTDKTAALIRDNSIVSHDFIEGAMAGCANSNEGAMDNFPVNFSSYLVRQQRWLRGDWQLLPFLKRKIKSVNGEKVANPISPIAKWHILRNMISSLVPIASILLLFAAMFSKSLTLTLCLAFAVPAFMLLKSIRESVLYKPNIFIVELMRHIYFLSCLPVIAYNNFKSIILTLIRMMRGKGLLEWRVFAHATQKINFLPNVLAAAVLITLTVIFRLNPVFYVFGGFFLLGIVLNYLMGKEYKGKEHSNTDAALLQNIAAKTWEYFRVQFDEGKGLPCDNYQEYENVGWARRTSPTNIGFALVAVASAYELGFIDRITLEKYFDLNVSAVEKLDKWHGNLFNWYDTESFATLEPKYVSSVDSGNFLACLSLAMSYVSGSLKQRIKKLIDETDLGALFDYKRGLFRIGYNYSTKTFDEGHYDLMGSEASCAYLIGIGLNKIDRLAWNNLSRQCVKYRGKMLYSWTGGMFEHLMTAIFFKYPKKTLIGNTAVNVARSHVFYAEENELPFWGISESLYNKVDENNIYQYRAFGVPNIAHSNLDDAKVVAPYASMLALQFNNSVGDNIRKMLKIGMLGDFGLYEAFDGEILRSYMTHHQGMIMGAICNKLTKGSLNYRMLQIPAVRAAEMLLSQSDNIKGARRRIPRPLAEKPTLTIETVEGIYDRPYINLQSNGRYQLLLDNLGNGYSVMDGVYLTRFIERNDGIKVEAELNGRRYPLLGGKTVMSAYNTVFENKNEFFMSKTEVVVLPDGGGEMRELTIRNLCAEQLDLNIFTCAEVILTDAADDAAHKAYSNLFVTTKYYEKEKFVAAKRNNRKTSPIYAHFTDKLDSTFETNRANYYGRGAKSQSIGEVLDPILSSCTNVKIGRFADFRIRLFFVAGYDEESLSKTVRLARTEGYAERIKGEAFALSKKYYVKKTVKKLASKIIFDASTPLTRSLSSKIDLTAPIVLLKVRSDKSLSGLKENLKEIAKLYKFGIKFNLCIVYTEKYGYFASLRDGINTVLESLDFYRKMAGRCTINIINETTDEKLSEKLYERAIDLTDLDYKRLEPLKKIYVKKVFKNADMPKLNIQMRLGLGGFTSDASYAMDLSAADTPAPWSNIIADKDFGTLITESGGGYSYQGNSRESKITKWNNDPVLDTPSECVILGENGNLWSLTKRPITQDCNYHVIHHMGGSEFIANYNGILGVQKEYILIGRGTKIFSVQLNNQTSEFREIDIMLALDLVLGDFKFNTNGAIEYENGVSYISVSNSLSCSQIFLCASEPIASRAFHKEAYFRDGGFVRNSDLNDCGSDKSVALSVKINLNEGETKTVYFAFGSEIMTEFKDMDDEFNRAKEHFGALSSLDFECADMAMTYFMKWLPYQIWCSRFLARAGYYQCGGAIGFRDQLQDCLSLLYVDKNAVREHILDCASHQFADGDVQHWWHKPTLGVRTRFMDDRLFLPYVVAEYIEFTGDMEILNEREPYLEDIPLEKGAASVYAAPEFTKRFASISEHCLKAIFKSCDFNKNDLVKMWGGDWNDAMDKIGHNGEGTTVWGSMFLFTVIDRFLPYVTETSHKVRLQRIKERLRVGVNKAWDGEWFTRAYTDDGKVVGSSTNDECRIDLLTQAWSKLSGIADGGRTDIALYSAEKRLVDKNNKIIKLLTPPFSDRKDIGYISDYPSGIRENGGQYTHAAVWYIMSLLESGKNQTAYDLLSMINPVNHSLTDKDVGIYRVEPYVLAADVYDGDYKGRGGWTWYTGAASWYYKCVIEKFLGISIKRNVLTLLPKLPNNDMTFNIKLKTEYGEIKFTVENSSSKGNWRMIVDGIAYSNTRLTLSNSIIGKEIIFRKMD